MRLAQHHALALLVDSTRPLTSVATLHIRLPGGPPLPPDDNNSDAAGGDMDISAWWVLGAFVVGGYAGALLVALISIAAGDSAAADAGEGRTT